ncbi:MAG TPA: gluconeogenesis factor YvcK family protein [Candidatus Saccharimonadales bacterium]
MAVSRRKEGDKGSRTLRVVTIGGGTGSFTLLTRFKNYFDDLTAIVNMADNGGSSGVLRDELGALPPGDVRQCLVALSEAPEELRELFNFRFAEGTLAGHTLGNLFLSAVEKMSSDFDEAIRLASEVLRIRGRVLPVTKESVQLELVWPDGRVVRGEFTIGDIDFDGWQRPELRLVPPAPLDPHARQAIARADVVVIAPGNLYGSLAPALMVSGMREALQATPAKVAYVCNLVTKPGQTDGFQVHDYAAEIERFVGAPVLDYVLYNTARPPAQLLRRYAHAGELPVTADSGALHTVAYQAVGLPLIADEPNAARAGDTIALTRSLIRHDADAVARELLKLAVL